MGLRMVAMAAGVLLAGGLILAGCAGGDDPGHGPADGGHMAAMQEPPEGSIRVGLRNWAVEPSVASVRAGKVTFWAVHEMEPHPHDGGGEIHDLQVLRKAADGSFELVGEVRDLAMGEAAALALELAPGEYELACTVVEEVNGEAVSHYEKGMRTPFVVTPS